jgi:hypothetical protein
MRLAFFILAAFTAIFAVASFDGFYFYDDYAYIFYAEQILSETYQLNNSDIFAHRLGFILPLALFIKIFGLNEWSVCSLPLLATLLSLYFLYLFSKKLASQTAIYALLFLGLDFYTLFFSNKVYPDVLLSTLALASLYILYHKRTRWYWALGFVFLNFWAFLCKELIIYLFPFYFLVFFKDLSKKQNVRFWFVAIVSVLLMTLFYLLLYYRFAGNPFFRFQAIEQGHYTASFSYFDKPFGYTLRRIIYEPFLMFINTSTMITLAGAIAFLVSGKWIKKFQEKTEKILGQIDEQPILSFFSMVLLSGLLMFWLMTTNFSAYNPIGLFPRHILFLLPLGALLSAFALEYKKITQFTALILLFSALWAWKSLGLKVAVLYALLACWILLKNYSFLKQKNALWTFGLAFILAIHPIYTMLKSSETGYWTEKEIFEKHILGIQKPSIIYTDDKLLTGHQWYFKFKKPDFIVFKDFADLEKDKSLLTKKYVLINEHSIKYFEEIGVLFPKFAKKTPNTWHKIAAKEKMSLWLVSN